MTYFSVPGNIVKMSTEQSSVSANAADVSILLFKFLQQTTHPVTVIGRFNYFTLIECASRFVEINCTQFTPFKFG